MVGIEPKAEVLKTPAEQDGGEDALGFPHGTQWRVRIDRPGSAPFEEIGHEPINRRCDECERVSDTIRTGLRRNGTNGPVKDVRWGQPHVHPDVSEMGPEEAIELLLVDGVEVIAVPPEPIAPFCRVEFIPGSLGAVGRKVWCKVPEAGPRVTKEFPSLVVFLMANPNFVILVNPGPGMQLSQLRRSWDSREGFRDSRGSNVQLVMIQSVLAQCRVQKRQEPVPSVVVVFPGIFAVEDD